MAIRTLKRTIGLVGIGWSGKTVFLTSLLSHLRFHKPEKLLLNSADKKNKAEIIKFEEIREGMDLPFFEHERFRNTLLDSKIWPGKTADASYFRCRFERTDWSWSNMDLTFLDFPGERFNDAVMFIGHGTFEDWSDAVLKRIENDPPCSRMAEEYFQILSEEKTQSKPNIKKIILSYKRLLSRFMLNYGAFITPSLFALDQKGRQPQYSEDLNEIALSALSGQTPATEFAPLPSDFRNAYPFITRLFSDFYKGYRESMVNKLYQQLGCCDKLLILVDIPGLLAANVGRFNDTEAILDYVLSSSIREQSLFSGILTNLYNFVLPSTMRFPQLNGVAFVATKADMVKYHQVDDLKHLLKELVGKKVKNYSIKYDFFVCSAIKSTVMKDGQLMGYPVYDPNGRRMRIPHPNDLMQQLRPSELPDEWPDYWESGQYYFPEVWPMVPHKKSSPPNQSGLEAILNFILED